MKSFLILLVLLVLLTKVYSIKAMLFCYLPAVQNTKLNRSQFDELARQVQSHLNQKNINVTVNVCSKQESYKLYDPTKINELFTVDNYDILEIDVMYLHAIKEKLLSFTKKELKSYFDQVFAFQWDPVRRVNDDGEQHYIGSPGLMCSDFIQTRKQDGLIPLIQAKINNQYSLMSMYTGYYLNTVKGSTIETMNYDHVNTEVIKKIKEFLMKCQIKKLKFDPKNNLCWNDSSENYFSDKKYTSTIGYSENLYKFFTSFQKPLSQQKIKVKSIMGTLKNKLVYLDQFIAKYKNDTQYKRTVLRFYEAMLDPQVLDIYTKGLYTLLPIQTTYLLPPTKKYFEEVAKSDSLYNEYYQQLFAEGTIHHPIYSSKYSQNMDKFYKKIIDAINLPQYLRKERHQLKQHQLQTTLQIERLL